jgi:hypothetical protein
MVRRRRRRRAQEARESRFALLASDYCCIFDVESTIPLIVAVL